MNPFEPPRLGMVIPVCNEGVDIPRSLRFSAPRADVPPRVLIRDGRVDNDTPAGICESGETPSARYLTSGCRPARLPKRRVCHC